MSAELDLDDVAAQSLRAWAELAALRLALREMTGRMVQMCGRPDQTARPDLPYEWRLIHNARAALGMNADHSKMTTTDAPNATGAQTEPSSSVAVAEPAAEARETLLLEYRAAIANALAARYAEPTRPLLVWQITNEELERKLARLDAALAGGPKETL